MFLFVLFLSLSPDSHDITQAAAEEALAYNQIVVQITSSLNTPHIPTRRIILDILVGVAYWDKGEKGEKLPQVISGLEALSMANNEPDGCFSYWFKSLENSLAGRGKMGSLVGASDEVRQGGGNDSSLNDYAVRVP
jgi:cytokinesis protein